MTSVSFLARTTSGFQLKAELDPRVRLVRKRALQVTVHFASSAIRLATREGTIAVSPGDAIVNDNRGRKWAVDRERFDAKYTPVLPVLRGQVGAYVSLRKEALALQMTQPFRVQLTDGVSELEGQSGDWLLDYGDGSLGVVAADAFQDSYDLV